MVASSQKPLPVKIANANLSGFSVTSSTELTFCSTKIVMLLDKLRIKTKIIAMIAVAFLDNFWFWGFLGTLIGFKVFRGEFFVSWILMVGVSGSMVVGCMITSKSIFKEN